MLKSYGHVLVSRGRALERSVSAARAIRAALRSLLALAASTSHPCARGYGVELPFPANLLLLPFSFLEVGVLWCVHADL